MDIKGSILAFLISVFVFIPLVLNGQDAPILEKWTVTYIVDGDTFYGERNGQNRTKFRLIGIDTPESKHPNKPVEPYSKEASERLAQLIDNKDVLLEYDVQTNDRYGRSLVYVYNVDGIFVNKELVEEGLAQVYTFPPNVKYVEVFHDAQRRARDGKKGMWQDNLKK